MIFGTMSMLLAAPTGGGSPDITSLFSVDLWTGNGTSQSINNGMNLTSSDALVWIKSRSAAANHKLVDTIRGAPTALITNATIAETSDANGVTSFGATGYSIGSDSNYNQNAATYVGWSYKKASRFFDIVTYTGNGSLRTIAHNLGVEPGLIIIKRRDATAAWTIYHRSIGATKDGEFAATAFTTSSTSFNDTAPTSSVFTVGTSTDVNASGGTYVAYLFAHDAASDGVVQCGSYTGNGSATGPTVNIGWRPQALLIKRDGAYSWFYFDSTRGIDLPNDNFLELDTSDAEVSNDYFALNSTGFQLIAASSGFNANGFTYTYMAIREP